MWLTDFQLGVATQNNEIPGEHKWNFIIPRDKWEKRRNGALEPGTVNQK